MKITCISDLHGYFPKLKGGDLLIIAGDLTARDTNEEHLDLMTEMGGIQTSKNPYKKIIYIAGNHDGMLDPDTNRYGELRTPYNWNIDYLCDSGTTFEGLKIWGSPHSLTFPGLNHKCAAFTGTEQDLKDKYDLIPNDIDILVTHSPAYGILDENFKGDHCGSKALLDAIERIRPKLHIFGHIHEQGGKTELMPWGTICVNASILTSSPT